jgi:flagellar biosynthesis protein FlhB
VSERTHAPSERRLKRFRERGIAPSAELALRVARLGVIGVWLYLAFDALNAAAPGIWACAFVPPSQAPTACLTGLANAALPGLFTNTLLCVAALVALSSLSRLAAPVARRPISPATALATLGFACALAMVAIRHGQAIPAPAITLSVVALAIIDAAEDRYRVRRMARMTSEEVADEAREQMMSEFARRWVRDQLQVRSRTDSRRRRGP